MKKNFFILLGVSLLLTIPIQILKAQTYPNIIVVLFDDLGVDYVGAYKRSPGAGKTPTLDALAAKGMLFRNAWSNPVCTPTRAGVMTGRYSFRTGLGSCDADTDIGLSLSEKTLPKVLKPVYSTYAVGKWHLSSQKTQDSDHPNKSGFDHYSGALYNLSNKGTLLEKGNYNHWEKVVDGKHSISTNYATTENVDDAIAAIKQMKSPWFLYLAFNAPHVPLHKPPASLHSYQAEIGGTKPRKNPIPHYKAMLEAADRELGRLLKQAPDAVVIVAGDNGTPKAVVQSFPEAPFISEHAKESVYEGGINVPLIIAGPGVQHGESDALVGTVDIFATVIELAGMSVPSSDSVSMVPYLKGEKGSKRQTLYSEIFWPNGSPFPHVHHQRAIRNQQYKLITKRKNNKDKGDEFYDLLKDPFEINDLLLKGLTAEQKKAYSDFKSKFSGLK